MLSLSSFMVILFEYPQCRDYSSMLFICTERNDEQHVSWERRKVKLLKTIGSDGKFCETKIDGVHE